MQFSRREAVTAVISGFIALLAGCTSDTTPMADYSDKSLQDAESVNDVANETGIMLNEEGELEISKFLLIKAGLDNVANSLTEVADAIREHK